MNNICIIQARSTSSRLPGKVLLHIGDKTILRHVYDKSREMSEALSQTYPERMFSTVIAIPKNDETLEKYLKSEGLEYYKGDEKDVLSRFYDCAREYKVTGSIIRLTSDCPFLSVDKSLRVINMYHNNSVDYVSNTVNFEYKREQGNTTSSVDEAITDLITKSKYRCIDGFDTEIFSMHALAKAYYEAKSSYSREHVTPFMHSLNTLFVWERIDLRDRKLSIDTKEDYVFLKNLYEVTHD